MTDFEKEHLQLKTQQGCVISKYLSVHTRNSVSCSGHWNWRLLWSWQKTGI